MRTSLRASAAWVFVALLAGSLGLGGCLAPPAESGPPEIALETGPDGEPPTVVVRGVDRRTLRQLGRDETRWSEVFALYTGSEAPPADQPPVLGEYRVEDGAVRFVPRFALLPGQPYWARWRGPRDGPSVGRALELPRSAAAPSTRVVAIYPSADRLPENLLRLYVEFSGPMTRGEASRWLRFSNSDGEPLPWPFVAPEHELWNPAGDRLTLLLDPGRIKRGVLPNSQAGAPLVAGQGYRLTVDPAWPDGHGVELLEPFEKAFQAVAADRRSPRPADWQIEPPTRSDAALTLTFPEPLDHGLLHTFLRVTDEAGQPIEGRAEVGERETRWRFHPRDPWRPGRHAVRVHPALEDLAGNSVRRVFDSPASAADTAPAGETVLPFEVRLGG